MNFMCLGNRVVTVLNGTCVRRLAPVLFGIRHVVSRADAGFNPGKVAVVTKTTSYEFEQQRYRYSELSEEVLKQLLAMKGYGYSGLLERHNIHTRNVEHIVHSLQQEGLEVRVVKRGDAEPIRLRFNRVSFEKRAHMDSEIAYILENDIAGCESWF